MTKKNNVTWLIILLLVIALIASVRLVFPPYQPLSVTGRIVIAEAFEAFIDEQRLDQ